MLNRNSLISAVLLCLLATSALAHHGWRWTSGTNIELIGIITETQLGNPHGVLKVQVEDEVWTVEVGQPWRNERAGLKDGDLAPGVEITVSGEPAADVSNKLLKAERLWIDGTKYEFYPERK